MRIIGTITLLMSLAVIGGCTTYRVTAISVNGHGFGFDRPETTLVFSANGKKSQPITFTANNDPQELKPAPFVDVQLKPGAKSVDIEIHSQRKTANGVSESTVKEPCPVPSPGYGIAYIYPPGNNAPGATVTFTVTKK